MIRNHRQSFYTVDRTGEGGSLRGARFPSESTRGTRKLVSYIREQTLACGRSYDLRFSIMSPWRTYKKACCSGLEPTATRTQALALEVDHRLREWE